MIIVILQEVIILVFILFYFNLFPYRRDREADRYDSDICIAKQWETNNFFGLFLIKKNAFK